MQYNGYNKQHYLIYCALLWVLTGCGVGPLGKNSDDGSGTDAQSAPSGIQSLAIAAAADLPPCAEANNQQLIYTIDTQQFHTCQEGAWVVIEIKGPQGDAGPAGPQGDTGATGQAGAPGDDAAFAIDHAVFCDSDLTDLDSDPGITLYGGNMGITRFSNGDFYVQCQTMRIDGTDTVVHANTDWVAAGNAGNNLTCRTLYTTHIYNIVTNTVTYENADDDLQYGSGDCTEGF